MKSVYKTFVSVIVSLSLLASTIVGALCVNLKTAHAALAEEIEDWDYLLDLFDLTPHTLTQSFISDVEDVLQGSWPESYSRTATVFFVWVIVDPNSSNFHIGIYGTEFSDALGFRIKPDTGGGYVCRGNSFSSNGIYCYGYCTYYNGNTTCLTDKHLSAYGNSTFNFGNDAYAWFCASNTTTSQYTVFLSCNIYSDSQATQISYPLNLVYSAAPVSAYDNIVIEMYDRFYFTTSDNFVIRDIRNHEISGYFTLTLEFGETGRYDFIIYPDNFTYLPYTSYPGITNISPNGVLAYDITGYVKSINAYALSSSVASPSESFPTYFSYTRCVFPYSPSDNDWAAYYDSLNQFISDQEDMHDPILVSTDRLADIPRVGANVRIVRPSGPDTQGTTFSDYDFSGNSLDVYVLDQSLQDMIEDYNLKVVVVPYSYVPVSSSTVSYQRFYLQRVVRFNDNNGVVVVGSIQDTYGYDYLFQCFDVVIFYPTQYFDHVTDAVYHYAWCDNRTFYGNPEDSYVNGYYYLTSRAYNHILSYTLTDGISTLADNMVEWADSQSDFLQAIVSGIGALVYDIQTLHGTLSNIYTILFNWDLHFQEILDNLQKIVDNTSTDEAEGGFWIEPLYLFVKFFEPSSEDYTNSISAIITTYEGLPAIPSVTPVAIPTSQIYIPGG